MIPNEIFIPDNTFDELVASIAAEINDEDGDEIEIANAILIKAGLSPERWRNRHRDYETEIALLRRKPRRRFR